MAEASHTIPRAQWSTHPHYPDQVLLLGSHTNFRQISRHLVARSDAGGELAGIASLYLRWIAGMRSHESYEERKLYPYLERRWQVSLAAAQAGHELLHRCHAEVIEAVRVATPGAYATPQLAAALRRHDLILHAHLELEEDLVIPRLLALSPTEFHAYTRAS